MDTHPMQGAASESAQPAGPATAAATSRSARPSPPGAIPDPRTGGNDAVCFTAGFAGAMFAAGAIHAYLAADRKPPAIVAGISMGALNAAAFQRCYQELKPPPSAKHRPTRPRGKFRVGLGFAGT